MRALPGFLLVVLLLFPASPVARAGEGGEAPPLTGTLERTGDMTVLTLWGTPRERGFTHGWLLAREIVSGFDAGLRDLYGSRIEVYDRVLVLVATAFRFDAAEAEEIRGILAGVEARLPDEADRRLATLGRPIDRSDLRALNVFGDVYALACTSLAVWGDHTADGTPSVARNFDFPALDLVLSDQHVRVVLPPPGSPTRRGWVGIGHPGGIGAATVMNEEGVFAAIHDVHVLPEAKDLSQPNVPRLLAIRRLAETLGAGGAVEEAARLCRTWPTLYGNNFVVATPAVGKGVPAGVLEYDTREADDGGVDVRSPKTGDGPEASAYVACTNHHRIRATGTCSRYDTVVDACQQRGAGPLGVADLFALASRAAVPAPGEAARSGRVATLHQVVAETGAGRLHVRLTRPGGNIRDAEAHVLDVKARLEAAKAASGLPRPR